MFGIGFLYLPRRSRRLLRGSASPSLGPPSYSGLARSRLLSLRPFGTSLCASGNLALPGFPSPVAEPSLCLSRLLSASLLATLRGLASGLKACIPSGLVFSPGFGDFGEFLKKISVASRPPTRFALQTYGVRLVSFADQRARRRRARLHAPSLSLHIS